MASLRFALRQTRKGKQVRKFAVGGLIVRPEYLRTPHLIGVPYHPPLVVIVPDFGRAVFNSAIRRCLADDVPVSARSLPMKVGGVSKSYSVEAAQIEYAIVDDDVKCSVYLRGDVHFCDEIVERLRLHFAADGKSSDINPAIHVCGIIDWRHLDAAGYERPRQSADLAVIRKTPAS